MKTTVLLLSLTLALSTAIAIAKTATGTIPVSVQIVSGSSVSAYLSGGDVITTVDRDAGRSAGSGAPPIVRVNFQIERSWFLVKRVTWDKLHRHLTIDF